MKARIITTTVVALLTGTVANAQNLSAYFNNNYIYANEANPALSPDCKTYISLPGIQQGLESTIGAYSLLYPSGNGFVTGLHQSISSEEFLGRIGESAKINTNGAIRILGLGGRFNENNYFSANIRIRETGGAILPFDAFRFIKEGSASSDSFDMSEMALYGDMIGEIALNLVHSFENITVGATAKVMNGLAHGSMGMDRLSIVTSPDKWTFEGEGNASAAIVNFNPGLAIDLGVSAHITDNLMVTAAILDLGGISWAATSNYRLPGGKWEYSGIDNLSISDEGSSSNIGDEVGNAIGDFLSKIEFEKDGPESRTFNTLPISANAGIKYTLPSWDKLSFGAVAAYKGGALYNTVDARAIIDIAPVKWFEMSASAGVSTEGTRGGILAVLNLGPVRAHMGAEMLGSQYGKFSGITIPIDKVRMMADFGLQLTFGR